MPGTAPRERVVQTAQDLNSVLQAHAESSSAFGLLLSRVDPPGSEEVERARLLVDTRADTASPAMREVAWQTLHAVRDVPHVDLTHFDLAPEAISLLSSAVASRYRVAPVMLWHDSIVLAIAELPSQEALGVLRFALQRHIVFVLAPPAQIDEAINRVYRSAQEAAELRKLT